MQRRFYAETKADDKQNPADISQPGAVRVPVVRMMRGLANVLPPGTVGRYKRRRNCRVEAQTMRVAVARNESVLPSPTVFPVESGRV